MNSYNHVAASDAERLRRKRRNRLVILLFFVVLGIVILLESPLTRVRTIVVSGNSSIPSARLVKESAIAKGNSLWQVNQSQIQSSIMKREPLVQSVSVKTNFLSGVVQLKISQKKIAAILQAQGKFYNVLSDGTVYSAVKQGSTFTLPIISVPTSDKVQIGRIFGDSDVTILCRELSTLQAGEIQHISQIKLDGLGSATLFMDDGFEVVLTVGNLKKQLPDVQSVVSYFLGKGYAPGIIDMSGQPPYRYTPFKTGKGS